AAAAWPKARPGVPSHCANTRCPALLGDCVLVRKSQIHLLLQRFAQNHPEINPELLTDAPPPEPHRRAKSSADRLGVENFLPVACRAAPLASRAIPRVVINR